MLSPSGTSERRHEHARSGEEIVIVALIDP
jgi:hypothetical protein